MSTQYTHKPHHNTVVGSHPLSADNVKQLMAMSYNMAKMALKLLKLTDLSNKTRIETHISHNMHVIDTVLI